MDITPVPESSPAPVAAEHPASTRRVRCEFCQCELAADGGVLKTSQRAREFRDVDDNLARALSDVQAARSEITRLTAELQTANARIGQLSDDLQREAIKKPWYRANE